MAKQQIDGRLTWRTVRTITTTSNEAMIADRTAAMAMEDVDHPDEVAAAPAAGRGGAPANLALTPPLDATEMINTT